jgi:hypothetical protein
VEQKYKFHNMWDEFSLKYRGKHTTFGLNPLSGEYA